VFVDVNAFVFADDIAVFGEARDFLASDGEDHGAADVGTSAELQHGFDRIRRDGSAEHPRASVRRVARLVRPLASSSIAPDIVVSAVAAVGTVASVDVVDTRHRLARWVAFELGFAFGVVSPSPTMSSMDMTADCHSDPRVGTVRTSTSTQ